MSQVFILKDIEGRDLGEIIYSQNGFQVNIIFEKEKNEMEKLLNKFFKEGIFDLGEVFLEKPILPQDPLFLNEIKNQLAEKGYIMIDKDK